MLNVTKENFATEVLASEKPVLLEFTATWCKHCKDLAPILAELETELADKLIIGKVDMDEQRELAFKFRIMGIPALALVKDGQVGDSVPNPGSKDNLLGWLQKQL